MPEKILTMEEVKGHVLDDLLKPEVRDFCAQQGVLEYVPVAVDLIQKCFTSTQNISLHLEKDPESGEAWVVVCFTTHEEVDKVLEDHRHYTRKWVASAPWPERSKIRLEFNLM